VAGVDVGGPRKGFHAVALQGGAVLGSTRLDDPVEVVAWCLGRGAQIIGVDAPCRWSADGHARPSERKLMADGIWCFATPTRRAAEAHPTGYYGWMLAGAELFRLLETRYPLYTGGTVRRGQSVCFETFPHAVTCALRGELVSARNKRRDRPEVLARAGIALRPRACIDTVDAALCALAALHLAANTVRLYGDAETGLIVVPRDARPL
jgi:predicted nuclease with RNAse H fold